MMCEENQSEKYRAEKYQDLYKYLMAYRRGVRKQEDSYKWALQARPSQMMPEGNWRLWMIVAGRGFGKTRTGAETIRMLVTQKKARRIALVAATEAEGRDVLIEGHSGILSCYPDNERPTYEPSKSRITWPCGAVATLYSAENAEKLRGPQFDCAWIDEFCKFLKAQEIWDQINFSLRLGDNPRVLITTTPKSMPLLNKLMQSDVGAGTIVTRGSTYENEGNLSSKFIDFIKEKYEGTTLGQQEVMGEIVDMREQGMWTPQMLLFATRNPGSVVQFKRTIVAIDPAVTSHSKSDETGILVAGLDFEGNIYVLDDLSGKFTPNGWAREALKAYGAYKADCIVGEVNQGGDMIASILRGASGNHPVPFRAVRASISKFRRAEPVFALYEQGRIFHMGGDRLQILESQMLDFSSDTSKSKGQSPDRLDALVWAVTELMTAEEKQGAFRVRNICGHS